MRTITVYQLFQERQNIRQLEKSMGFDVSLTDNERAMLEFIASREGTRITDIRNEDYFNDISMSTIKRSVTTLQTNSLVKNITTNDGRDRAMVLDIVSLII
jgi:Fe2+ or Zn2+ uptake regulation protein